MLNLSYYYFLLKILDLFDTVSFFMPTLNKTADSFHEFAAFYYSKEEECTLVVLTLLSSLFHVLGNICWWVEVNKLYHNLHFLLIFILSGEMDSWWSFNYAWHHQCFCTQCNVSLLLPLRNKTQFVEICVEEENYSNPNGEWDIFSRNFLRFY